MTGRPKVLVVGDFMRDVLVVPEGAMRHGSDVNASIKIVPGGSAANQAAWLAQQQVEVTLVARVGSGDRTAIAGDLAKAGVHAQLSEDNSLPTGTLVNLSEPDGERSFFTDRGANQNLRIEDVPPEAVSSADLILVSGYMFFAGPGRRTALGLMEVARSAGTPIAVDAASAGYISDAGVQAFLGWTANADLFFANAEEAALLSGETAIDRQIAALLASYAQIVIKQGPDGASGAAADRVVHHSAALAANCLDSTGAGDAFAAGYLAAYLRGADQPACLAAGNSAAALAVGQIGGSPVRG